jgi:hypothetical protein
MSSRVSHALKRPFLPRPSHGNTEQSISTTSYESATIGKNKKLLYVVLRIAKKRNPKPLKTSGMRAVKA